MVDKTEERTLEIFNDSLETCTTHPAFLDKFYDFFVNASPEIAEKFAHTDIENQKHALHLSLYTLLMEVQGNPEADEHLKHIADLHSHTQLDIKPELYAIWLDCLLKAVRMFDPDYNDEVEQAWRYVMQKGIDFMIAHY